MSSVNTAHIIPDVVVKDDDRLNAELILAGLSVTKGYSVVYWFMSKYECNDSMFPDCNSRKVATVVLLIMALHLTLYSCLKELHVILI